MDTIPADSLQCGLSSAEARRRLAETGPNATPDTAIHPLRMVLGKFVAPVPCLLEAAIALQLALGEYVEASIIAVLLVFNAALGLLHEGRAQATVAALKSRLALSASVRRDGAWTIVPAADLVPGDIVKLSLGSVVAADVRLVSGAVLLDQSLLTGESLPIEAGPGRETYAGALVRRGEAVAEVTRPARARSSAAPRNSSARRMWSVRSRRPSSGSYAISPCSTALARWRWSRMRTGSACPSPKSFRSS
jgi:magnesium-transporting ATPase (P-type)